MVSLEERRIYDQGEGMITLYWNAYRLHPGYNIMIEYPKPQKYRYYHHQSKLWYHYDTSGNWRSIKK